MNLYNHFHTLGHDVSDLKRGFRIRNMCLFLKKNLSVLQEVAGMDAFEGRMNGTQRPNENSSGDLLTYHTTAGAMGLPGAC